MMVINMMVIISVVMQRDTVELPKGVHKLTGRCGESAIQRHPFRQTHTP